MAFGGFSRGNKGVLSTMSGATTRDASRPFDESRGKKKSSLFSKFNTRVQEAIEEGRGEEAVRQAVGRSVQRASGLGSRLWDG